MDSNEKDVILDDRLIIIDGIIQKLNCHLEA